MGQVIVGGLLGMPDISGAVGIVVPPRILTEISARCANLKAGGVALAPVAIHATSDFVVVTYWTKTESVAERTVYNLRGGDIA